MDLLPVILPESVCVIYPFFTMNPFFIQKSGCSYPKSHLLVFRNMSAHNQKSGI